MRVTPTPTDFASSVCFALAIAHTFFSSRFHLVGSHFRKNSVQYQIFHLLGEVEVIFGVWALIFLVVSTALDGAKATSANTFNLSFTEPLFVFVIMIVSATAPILFFANLVVIGFAKILPINRSVATYFACLTIGPLLGSFITEPAAMTISALLLKQKFFDKSSSEKFKYITLALLLVNISIGGVLTPFAAPAVLMVAKTWGWDLQFMLLNFGWRAVAVIIVNTAAAAFFSRNQLEEFGASDPRTFEPRPVWLVLIHFLFLFAVILSAHHFLYFALELFAFGLFVKLTSRQQSRLRVRESAFVAVFLVALVVIGTPQKWWLDHALRSLSEMKIYFSATLLTAVTDNAALTFLGSQIENLSDAFKYYLVAGAIVGGGLTVMANAPNPAAFAILESSFENSGIKPFKLLLFALPPTLFAFFIFAL